MHRVSQGNHSASLIDVSFPFISNFPMGKFSHFSNQIISFFVSQEKSLIKQ